MGVGSLAATTLVNGYSRAQDKGSGRPPSGTTTKVPPEGSPAVHIPDVSIFVRSPDSVRVGVATSEMVEIKLVEVLKLHGYCAGGVAFAFRAAQEAFRVLYGDQPPIRQSIRVYTSVHCCQAGALAYITGARTDFGAFPSQGDLVLLPEDEKKYVFMDKKTKSLVTLRLLFNPHDIFSPIFKKIRKDPKEPTFAPQARKKLNDAVQAYIYGPVENLFMIEKG